MKWGRTLLLILLLVLLSLYFYVVEVKRAEQTKRDQERRKEEEWRKSQVFPYLPDCFKRIRLVKEGRVLEYYKEGSLWWMKEPMVREGDAHAVDDIIQAIISVVETDPVSEDPEDLAQFGLDRPALEIAVELEGEAEERILLIGSDNPTSTTLYAQLKGSPRVFLVGSLIRWEVSKEFYNLDHHRGPFFAQEEEL